MFRCFFMAALLFFGRLWQSWLCQSISMLYLGCGNSLLRGVSRVPVKPLITGPTCLGTQLVLELVWDLFCSYEWVKPHFLHYSRQNNMVVTTKTPVLAIIFDYLVCTSSYRKQCFPAINSSILRLHRSKCQCFNEGRLIDGEGQHREQVVRLEVSGLRIVCKKRRLERITPLTGCTVGGCGELWCPSCTQSNEVHGNRFNVSYRYCWAHYNCAVDSVSTILQ